MHKISTVQKWTNCFHISKATIEVWEVFLFFKTEKKCIRKVTAMPISKIKANASTKYRIGAVSKMFTK